MEIKAQAKFLRISPRKLRLITGLIQSMAVAAAADQLKHLDKKGSTPVLKLLNSAIANASHNNKLKVEGLFIKSAFVDQGPTIKRWRPRAFGRAGQIRKRTSHLTIILEERKLKEEKTDEKASKEAEKKSDNKRYKKQAAITKQIINTKG